MPWPSRPLRPVLIGGLVGLGVLAGLLAVRHAPRPALRRAVAVSDALRASRGAGGWGGARWDRASVDAIDANLTRVAFWDGPRIVGEIALRRNGSPAQVDVYVGRSVPFGNWVAYEPAVLVLLGALFVLGCGVAPLRRRRNLDVLAALSLVVPLVLLAHRYVAASVVSALPGLLLLATGGARLALQGAREEPAQIPLLDALSPRWSAAQRVRLLRLALLALGLVYLMVAVSSPGPVDVIYGVMEGATKLVAGILPYGHLPGDVIHGDTYPIGSYALYAPLAWLAPVHSTWDSVDLALGTGAGLALLSAWLVRVSARGAAWLEPSERDAAGLRAALTWLAFPPLLVAVSSGTTDVLLAALVLGALCAWRRPALSAALLTLGGWVKLAPFALLPLWLVVRRGRQRRAAGLAVVAVTAAALGLVVALGGVGGPAAMVHAVAFQFSRGSPQSVWSALPVAWLQPVAQAALAGGLVAVLVHLRQHPDLLEAPARLAGLTLAVLTGLELAADYWSVLYLVWIAGLLPLSVLRPAPARATAAALRQPIRPLPVSAPV